MRLTGLIAIGLLLMVQLSQWETVTAELQGPQVVAEKLTSTSNEKSSSSSLNAQNQENDENAGNEEVAKDIPSNQRKAAKYIDDQMEAAKAAAQIAANIQGAEADGKNKLLKFAIFERLWSEEVVRKKLQEEIELLEAKQEPQEVIDPTPEQIEGLYICLIDNL